MHVALLLALVCTAAAVALRKEPFQSQRARSEVIANYDVVSPVITHKEGAGIHFEKLQIKISEKFVLNLEKNKNLIAPHFKSTHYDDAGGQVITKGLENCYYHGEVEGHPEWSVTMSTCQGLQGSFGDIKDRENFYQIEPLDSKDTTLQQPHALYLTSEYQRPESNCGSGGKHRKHSAMDLVDLNVTELHTRIRRQTGAIFYVELVVVSDQAQYIRHGRNLAATVQRALDLANVADRLFRALGIRIVLVGAITWSDADKIPFTPDQETLLDHFVLYKPQITVPHDAAMLLTGGDLFGNTVGIAYIRTMCSHLALGITQDTGHSSDYVGSIIAHELGHNLGMEHDDSSCTCNDPTGSCIMAADSPGFTPISTWSSCSRLELVEGLFGSNLQHCLTNTPTTTIGDPVCGNGIQERDEVCDCGSPEECLLRDPCCDPQTCQLARDAQCRAGPCCQPNCQFRPYGTTCRAASGQCDIAEYCSGDSSECPRDDYRQDGTPCNSGTSYCFDAVCQSYDKQCQFHFGNSSGKAIDGCFTVYNMRGDQFGNCGYSATGFRRCAPSDVQCGQLHCIPGEYQRRVLGVVIITAQVFNRVTQSLSNCRSFTTLPGSDEMSPGVVHDGTKCGSDRLCFQQRCIPESDLNIPPCPIGENGQICSGKGICSHNSQCSCNAGFIGMSCQTPYSGPESILESCAENNGGCAHICIDDNRFVQCSCRTGYTLARDDKNCNDIDECQTSNGGCEHTCTNTPGSRECSCRPGFTLASDGRCQEALTVSIIVDYTRPADFNGGPDEYRAASGPVRVTCTATGPGTETISYQWSSTCSSCPFQSATGSSVTRAAVHSGDNGTHTCVATRGGTAASDSIELSTATASIVFHIVGAGLQLFKGIPRGNLPYNGLALSVNPTENTFRLRIFCRSDSMSKSVGELIGLDGIAVTTNSYFAITNLQCGEIKIENVVGSQSALTPSQEGIYTCRIPLQSGEIKEIDFGIYRNEFNTPPRITALTVQASSLSSNLTCTSTGSPATTVTWRRNNQPLSVDGATHQMIQTVISRVESTYENVLIINQTLTSIEGDSFDCTVENILGSAASDSLQISVPVNECETNNGGCEQICTDAATSFECSCNSGYTLGTDGRTCNDINECNTNNGGCEQICTNTPGSRVCSCRSGFRPASDSTTCQDINECNINNGGCADLCTNTPGSHRCGCSPGFSLASDGRSCNDVDECNTNNGGCAQLCSNTVGSRVCSCRPGFNLANDGASCTDNDECSTNNGGCAQICTNIPGSRECSCRPGYRLLSDGSSCQDINECNTNNGGCAQTCTNTEGSHRCSCRPGYQLASDSRVCQDIDECSTDNGGCEQTCDNTQGSWQCSCGTGFILSSDGSGCTERLSIIISIDYTRPAGFNGGPDEYRAASGPVRVTCTATGPGSGPISYQWSSTCRSCPFQTATGSSVARAAVHSGDTGTHTCHATRDGYTANASINFTVVDAGIRVFRGTPRGNSQNNGLAISEDPTGSTFRLRIFCRSDTTLPDVGEFVGLDGTSLSSNTYLDISRRQPGELSVENIVGSQSALTANQEGVYTCHIPLHNGEMREFNIGIYSFGYNTPPQIMDCTVQYSSTGPNSSCLILICITTGSPPTTVSWIKNTLLLILNGDTYQMTLRVTNRSTSTYEIRLVIKQSLDSLLGSIFTIRIENILGFDSATVRIDETSVPTNPTPTATTSLPSITTTSLPSTTTATPSTTQPPRTSCGEALLGDSGSFQSPGWPAFYPNNIDCEWTITLSNRNRAIRFTFDRMYGIDGQPPCPSDYVDILNGHKTDAPLLGRFCSRNAPVPLVSSIGQARVVFHAGPQHPSNLKGFRITYQAVDRPQGDFRCGNNQFVASGTPFGPPAFPNPLTANNPTSNRCTWWTIVGTPGVTRAQLRIFYFDIPENNGCSQNSLKIHNSAVSAPATLSQTLCGELEEYVFVSAGNSMSVVLDIGSRTGYRGFHAVFETVN